MRPLRLQANILALGLLVSIGASAYAQFSGPAPDKATLKQQPPVSLQASPALLLAPPPARRLQAGDQVEVNVFGVKDFDQKVRVDHNGDLQLPLIGNVHVGGETLEEAEQHIAKALDDAGMMRDAQVTVTAIETPNQVITVAGEVKNPGVVSATGPRTLIEALAASGGLTTLASHAISVERKGIDQPITVQLGPDITTAKYANIPVYPGDTIIVPRVGVVYVVGAVPKANAYPMENPTPLTLIQAVTLAGGVNFEAAKKDTRIIRTLGEKRVEIPVNLGKVLEGKEDDPILHADDIVYVPTSVLRGALKSNAISTASQLALAIAYITPTL